jgi:hypothetical protein
VPTGGGLRYRLVADMQPIVHPATLRVVVVPPSGFRAQTGSGWSAADGTMVATRQLTRGVTFNLDLNR